MKFMVPRLAKRYAKKMCPVVRQGFHFPEDMITGIWMKDEIETSRLFAPVCYYTMREDKEYLYGLFCFFHHKDRSTWIPPFKALDEHDYDFEGCLIKRDKKYQVDVGIITVFHNNFKYGGLVLSDQTVISIEKGGHGISPGTMGADGNEIIYKDFDMVNMAYPSTLKWLKKDVQPAFNPTGVKLPWQWNDENLVTHFGRERTEGLMWRNPKLLFKLAKEAKLL